VKKRSIEDIKHTMLEKTFARTEAKTLDKKLIKHTLPEKSFQRTETQTLATPKKCSFCKETGHNKTTCRRQKITSVVKKRSVDDIKPTMPEKSIQRTETQIFATEIQSKAQGLERNSSTDTIPMAERPFTRMDTPNTMTQETFQKPLGLTNPGWNCCFMNSTLQILRSVKELVEYFISGDASLIYGNKENVDIAKEFDVLLQSMASNINVKEKHRIFMRQMWSI
jgi:hypothetical protein